MSGGVLMKRYRASLVLDQELTVIEFETDIPPVEWLWQRYGMSTYIESLKEVEAIPEE